VFPEGSPSPSAIMERLLPLFASYVRAHPEQWLILHRFWSAEAGEATHGLRNGNDGSTRRG
jgi:lauroyl/myristoyl acyltransferase